MLLLCLFLFLIFVVAIAIAIAVAIVCGGFTVMHSYRGMRMYTYTLSFLSFLKSKYWWWDARLHLVYTCTYTPSTALRAIFIGPRSFGDLKKQPSGLCRVFVDFLVEHGPR